MKYHNNHLTIEAICAQMRREEKSLRTIEKYVHDINMFLDCLKDPYNITEEDLIGYKEMLKQRYKITSANSMIASVNYYLHYIQRDDLHVKCFRLQKNLFRNECTELTREEYLRLLECAKKEKKERLYMIMLTLAMTGIRISELPFVTVESIYQQKTVISLKGKTRVVILPKALCDQLKAYANENQIIAGSLFVTCSGKNIDRSNIVHDMKKVGSLCGICPSKIYPHNFRHLFAVTYYEKQKDISRLADILGHSSINTTRIYISISMEMHQKQLEEMNLFVPYDK